MIPQRYRGAGWRRNKNPKVCFQIKVLPPHHSSESLESKLYLGADLMSREESWASETLPFHSLDTLSSSLESSGLVTQEQSCEESWTSKAGSWPSTTWWWCFLFHSMLCRPDRKMWVKAATFLYIPTLKTTGYGKILWPCSGSSLNYPMAWICWAKPKSPQVVEIHQHKNSICFVFQKPTPVSHCRRLWVYFFCSCMYESY